MERQKENAAIESDLSLWERFENSVKESLYRLMHELLQAQISSQLFYALLLVIEMIQLMYYQFAFKCHWFDSWQTQYFNYFQYFLDYFQFNYLLYNSSSSTITLGILYGTFGVAVVTLLLVIIIVYIISSTKRSNSTLLSYSIRALSFIALLYTTVATIPLFNIIAVILSCNDNSLATGGIGCTQGLITLHMLVAAVSAVLITFFTLIFYIYYIDLNPASPIPFAQPLTRIGLVKFVLKIGVVVYDSVDYDGVYTKQYVSAITVVYLFLCIYRYQVSPFYYRSTQIMTVCLEAGLLWLAFCSAIASYLTFNQDNSLTLAGYFLLVIPFAYSFLRLVDSRKWAFKTKELSAMIKDHEIEVYVDIFIDLIEKRSNREHRLKLEGLLKRHQKLCKHGKDCPCNKLLTQSVKDEETAEDGFEWYTVLDKIITDQLDRFPKSTKLHLLYSYLQHEKLKNKFKALFQLTAVRAERPTLEEEFSAFRFQRLIEDEMIDNEMRNSEIRGFDVMILVSFQEKFSEFQNSIYEAVEGHLDFWKGLLEENPDIQKLQVLGNQISKLSEACSTQFRTLTELNQNNIRCLEMYGNFLKDIINDDVEGNSVRADYVIKSTIVNKQFVDLTKIKYGENSETCIAVVSGNQHNMGEIVSANNEWKKAFGFDKWELIGENIRIVLPRAYAIRHDGFMNRFFETGKSRVLGEERVMFGLNKKGYIFPVTLMIKIVPNLENGIQVVGFIKEEKAGQANPLELKNTTTGNDVDQAPEDMFYMMFGGDENKIEGVSQNCLQAYSLSAKMVNSELGMSIDEIMPELLSTVQHIEDLRSPAGVVVTLDLAQIRQKYMAEDNSEDEYEVEGWEKEGSENSLAKKIESRDKLQSQRSNSYQRREDKVRVRCFLIREEHYDDNDAYLLNLIKFVEVNEEEEMKKLRTKESDVINALANPSLKALKKDEKRYEKTRTRKMREDSVVEAERQTLRNQDDDALSDTSGSSLADEMRQLKDFKAMISEKTVPKSIRLLQRVFLILFGGLVCLAIAELYFKLTQDTLFQEGETAIYYSQRSKSLLASININTRLFNLLGQNTDLVYLNGMTASDYETVLLNLIDDGINTMQLNQFTLLLSNVKMKSRQSNPASDPLYSIQMMLQDQSTTTYSSTLNDAIFQYVTYASTLQNGSIFSGDPSLARQAQFAFFFIFKNGIDQIRSGSEAIAKQFYNFYTDQLSSAPIVFMIIMIGNLVFVIVLEGIIVPIVFGVHRIGNRVMALFAFMPKPEIGVLLGKCDAYKAKFLKDTARERELAEHAYKHEEHKAARQQEMQVIASYIQDSKLDESGQPENVQESMMHNSHEIEDKVHGINSLGGVAAPGVKGPGRDSDGVSPPRDGKGKLLLSVPGQAANTDNRKEKPGDVIGEKAGENGKPDKEKEKAKPVHAGLDLTDVTKVAAQLAAEAAAVRKRVLEQKRKEKLERKKMSEREKKEWKERKKAEELRKMKEEEAKAEEDERTRKLLTSKSAMRNVIILEFIAVTAILAAFFVLDYYFFEVQYRDTIASSYTFLQLISVFPSILKFNYDMTIEAIVNGTTVVVGGTDLNQYYYNLFYQSEIGLYGADSGALGGSFSTFTTDFHNYAYNDVCSLLYGSNTTNATSLPSKPSFIRLACDGVATGLMTKGMKIASVSVVELCKEALTRFLASGKNTSDQISVMQSANMINAKALLDHVTTAQDMLTNEFVSSFQSYTSQRVFIEKAKFGIYLAALLFLFVLVWGPFLGRLSKNIWKVKGMLNMIPMELISRNEELKRKFISGDLLKAVK